MYNDTLYTWFLMGLTELQVIELQKVVFGMFANKGINSNADILQNIREYYENNDVAKCFAIYVAGQVVMKAGIFRGMGRNLYLNPNDVHGW